MAKESSAFDKEEIAKALAAAMSDIATIPKDGRNQQQGYGFTSEAAIANTLRPIMAKHGLSLMAKNIRVTNSDTVQTKNSVMQRVAIEATYLLLHKSGESIELTVPGEGMDSLDKSIPKAMTMAYKYAMIQVFCVGRGEDPDNGAGYEGHDRQAHDEPVHTENSAVRAAARETAPGSDFEIGFGTKWKGKMMSEVDNGYLNWMIEKFYPEAISDSSRANYRSKNVKELEMCKLEKMRRVTADVTVFNTEDAPF